MFRFLLLSLFALVNIACADNPKSKLFGSWSSDDAATKDYLTSRAVLSEYQKKVLPMLFGRVVITFNQNGTGTMKMSAAKIPKKGGGIIELQAENFNFKYEIIGESKSQIVIKLTAGEAFIADYPFSILKFHDDNNYSVLLSDGITELNGREFFKRIEAKPIEQSEIRQSATRPESKSEGNVKPKFEGK